MMGILLTITEDKVKLVSHFPPHHATEGVFHLKNYVTEISHGYNIIILLPNCLVELKLKYSFISKHEKQIS